MDIPKCTKGKNHAWKKGSILVGESGICAKCGYDRFDQCYRDINL